MIRSSQNMSLTYMASEEEVKSALFMMHLEKAPGPDGIITLFLTILAYYQNDVPYMVNELLKKIYVDERLNITNIYLIPKIVWPSHMTELRPISLCNMGYKIISKVLCQRLKRLLPQLVSETQSTFVSWR